MGRRKRRLRKGEKRARFRSRDLEKHPWKTAAAERKKKRIEEYSRLSA